MDLFTLAQKIIEKHPIITDIRSYMMYRFDGRVWRDDTEGLIHRELVKKEGRNFKPYHLTTLKQMIQGKTFTTNLQEPPPNLMCFKNGIVNLNHERVLKPHTPKYFFRNMIDAEYNPNADCPEFKKWLVEVLPEKEKRNCIQELFGYSLYRDYPLHKIIFLVGSGRNGKTTLLKTLIDILGKDSCTSVPLELLGERFQATNLIGKLVNIVTEPKTKLLRTEMVKKLTGQDLIHAEIKGKQRAIEFFNYAKLIVVANKLPPVRDDTLAWWDRVVVVEFEKVFKNPILNIENRWLKNPEERSGIVNWALEGLKRLLKNGRFSTSERMRLVVEQYKKYSNPVQYFVSRYCVVEPLRWVSREELYEHYKDVCDAEGLMVVSNRVFANEIRKLPGVGTAYRRIEGQTRRIWTGIGLRVENLLNLV